MIKDRKTAEEIIEVVNKCYQMLDGTIPLVKQNCSDEEIVKYAQYIGQILACLSLDIRDQIYEIHPELIPEGYENIFRKKG